MAYIKGISYYLPERVVTNEELLKEFPEWSVDKVAKKVGVNSRHLAAKDETAGDMAEKAARKLFEEYNVSPNDIDFVMLCTQSPDYFLPSTACILQHKLGIPTTAGAFDYNLGCSGCVYGLAMAKGLISAGIAKNVLVLTAETYNKYLHPSDKSNRSIFGDGAAACLVSTEGFAELAKKCHDAKLSVLLFTGYSYKDLLTIENENIKLLLENSDVLVDGEFVEFLYDEERDWVGSTNQCVIFLSDRYHAGVEFERGVHSTDIRVSPGGIEINGWPIEIDGHIN